MGERAGFSGGETVVKLGRRAAVGVGSLEVVCQVGWEVAVLTRPHSSVLYTQITRA